VAVYTILTVKVWLFHAQWFCWGNISAFAVLQIWLVILLFGMFTLYLALLVWALVEILLGDRDRGRILASIALSVTIFGFACPSPLRKKYFSALLEYMALVQYLAFGPRRRDVIGQMDSLLKAVLRSGHYRDIHIVGYSFGTIVAMDAIYRPCGGGVSTTGDEEQREEVVAVGAPPPEYSHIKSLVTFGCPFDLVRSYMPWYFSNDRKRWQDRNSNARWTNIWIPSDVFGSNFRNDSRVEEAVVGVHGDCKDGHVTESEASAGVWGVPHNEPFILSPGRNICGSFASGIALRGLEVHTH